MEMPRHFEPETSLDATFAYKAAPAQPGGYASAVAFANFSVFVVGVCGSACGITLLRLAGVF